MPINHWVQEILRGVTGDSMQKRENQQDWRISSSSLLSSYISVIGIQKLLFISSKGTSLTPSIKLQYVTYTSQTGSYKCYKCIFQAAYTAVCVKCSLPD